MLRGSGAEERRGWHGSCLRKNQRVKGGFPDRCREWDNRNGITPGTESRRGSTIAYGKTKTTISIDKEEAKEAVLAKAKEAIADKLTGNIVKEIYVPGRIVNIVQK